MFYRYSIFLAPRIDFSTFEIIALLYYCNSDFSSFPTLYYFPGTRHVPSTYKMSANSRVANWRTGFGGHQIKLKLLLLLYLEEVVLLWRRSITLSIVSSDFGVDEGSDEDGLNYDKIRVCFVSARTRVCRLKVNNGITIMMMMMTK